MGSIKAMMNEINIAFPPVDPFVPDFTAGLIKGFTGNDHRAQLDGCMTDLDPLASDIWEALGDMKHFHIFKMAGDLGKFIWMLPDAVKTCGELTALSEDLSSMLDWAKLLKDPEHVAAVAAKHWVFHGTEIKADMEKTKTDYNAQDYFGAGQDTAAVLTGLLPIDTAPTVVEFLN